MGKAKYFGYILPVVTCFCQVQYTKYQSMKNVITL